MGAIQSFIKNLPPEDRQRFGEMYASLPPDIEAKAIIVNLRAGQTLLRMEQPATTVYLLLKGRVKAMNEHISGSVYVFANFDAPSFFGEFEAFAGCPNYRGTLACAEACTLAALPTSAYLAWMKRDVKALFERTCDITQHLVMQAGAERSFLFSSGLDRMLVYLINKHEKMSVNGKLLLAAPRQQIADETGLSTKTVQRSLQQLEGRGIFTACGRKISINQSQYEQMLALREERVSGGEASHI